MYTKEEVFCQLEDMGASRKGVTMVQASFAALEEIDGGAEAFLEMLIEYFAGRGGILMIPTGTWDRAGRDDMVTLNCISGETCEGEFSELAAKHPKAICTGHPVYSAAVFGNTKKVREYIGDESIRLTPCAPIGCYGKLYDKGQILLIGVGQEKNHYLHAVEEMLGIPNRLSKKKKRVTILFKNLDFVEDHVFVYERVGLGDVAPYYPKYEPAFRYYGAIQDGKIGNAPVQLCDPQIIHAVMMMIQDRSNGIELLADDVLLQESWYK